jgi:HEAT repeat protein
MALFFGRKKTPELVVLAENIFKAPVKLPLGLKRKLNTLNFEECWALIKKVSLDLDHLKARSLVRFLFAEQAEQVRAQLENKAEIKTAIFCLQYLPAPETVQALVNLLNQHEKVIQLQAAEALKNQPPRLVVPVLIEKLLKNEIPPARAGEALMAMGHLAQDALLDAYQQASPEAKVQVLELLIISQNPKCERFLSEALASENINLKRAALKAISVFLFRDFWPKVVECLKDSPWPIKVKSLQVLTRFRVGEAKEVVRPLLEDEDPWVRQAAQKYFTILELE